MKKQLLLGTALFLAISAFPQTSAHKPKPSGLVNVRLLAASKFGASEGGAPNATVKSNGVASLPVKGKSAGTSSFVNTWKSFTSSMNIYGSSNSYCKPLQWNDELNAVTFLHRKSPSYVSSPPATGNAENGTIVAMISTDCGENWDSTAMWVNNNFWGRFPGGAIYNPSTANTDMSNAYIVGSGPTTGAGNVTWTGNWYASKKLGTGNYNNAPGDQKLSQTAGTLLPNVPRHDFAAYSFSSTDDGKIRVLAGVQNDNLTPKSDTAIMLINGTFNSGAFDWSGQLISVPTTTSSSGAHNFVSRPMMAWNEAGTVGYIVIMGSRKGATLSNVGYQPIVYKTINSGSTWTLENGIDFNTPAYADVKRSIVSVAIDSTLEVPNFFWGEGIDCTVDANNKLHIFTSILGHSSNNPDSLDFVRQFTDEKFLWPHTPGFRPYLYDFVYDGTNTTPSWSHITIDSMFTEGPGATVGSGGYNDNPWDTDPSEANRKIGMDARLQMSRTPDGKYLVYTWAESDLGLTEEQRNWNTMPDIKTRVYDVVKGSLNPMKVDVTYDAIGDIAHRGTFHFVSPKCKFISDISTGEVTGPILSVPMTISNSAPYAQLGPNTHWYSCAALGYTVSTVGVAENALNSVNGSYVYPNPAKNSASVNVTLYNTSKVNVQVLNAMGQVVKTTQAAGQVGSNTIDLNLDGLSSGIYLVQIKVDNATSTKKLIVD